MDHINMKSCNNEANLLIQDLRKKQINVKKQKYFIEAKLVIIDLKLKLFNLSPFYFLKVMSRFESFSHLTHRGHGHGCQHGPPKDGQQGWH